MWQKIGWFQLIGQGFAFLRGSLPSFSHSMLCSVYGGPEADIRRIWFLCVSVVYGRFRNRVRTANTPIRFDATWDISAKSVSFELNYDANATSGFSGSLSDPGSSGAAYLARGPEQLTIGGGWNSVFSPALAGIYDATPAGPASRPNWVALITDTGCIGTGGNPAKAYLYTVYQLGADGEDRRVVQPKVRVLRELPAGRVLTIRTRGLVPDTYKVLKVEAYPYTVQDAVNQAGIAGNRDVTPAENKLPRLPDEGRVITSGEKRDHRVQPPKPPIDGHSRGSVLALVAAALQTPCFLPEAPPCTRNNHGSGGLFVLPAGAKTSAEPEELAALWSKRRDAVDWALADAGPDGYPLDYGDRGQVVNYGG